MRYELLGLTAREIGRDFGLDRMPQPRLPAEDLPVGRPRAPARQLRGRLPEGGGRGGRPGPQPARVLGVPQRGRALRRRAGQFLDHRPRVRRLQPYHQGLLRDPGGHAARALAARLHAAAEAARHRGAQVLLRRRRRRESPRPARRAAPGLGALRQGLRELGLPRAARPQRLPRGVRPSRLLAAGQRHRGRLHRERPEGRPSRPRPRPGSRRTTCGGCAPWPRITRGSSGASSSAWRRGAGRPRTAS